MTLEVISFQLSVFSRVVGDACLTGAWLTTNG